MLVRGSPRRLLPLKLGASGVDKPLALRVQPLRDHLVGAPLAQVEQRELAPRLDQQPRHREVAPARCGVQRGAPTPRLRVDVSAALEQHPAHVQGARLRRELEGVAARSVAFARARSVGFEQHRAAARPVRRRCHVQRRVTGRVCDGGRPCVRRRVQRSPPAQIERRHAGADGATPECGECLGAVGLGGEVQPALELRPEPEEPRSARALLDTLRLRLRLLRLRLPRRTQQRGTPQGLARAPMSLDRVPKPRLRLQRQRARAHCRRTRGGGSGVGGAQGDECGRAAALGIQRVPRRRLLHAPQQ
eukprot:scaffold131209_cov63-Phaeocystis_antarctica.AAC.5